MDVWLVEKYDVESSEVLDIYNSSIKAEKAIIEARDKEVIHLQEMIEFCKKDKYKMGIKMYRKMIKNITKGNDWIKWKNYPHTNFSIVKREVK